MSAEKTRPEHLNVINGTTLDQQMDALGQSVDSKFAVDPLAVLATLVERTYEPVSTQQVIDDMDLFWR